MLDSNLDDKFCHKRATACHRGVGVVRPKDCELTGPPLATHPRKNGSRNRSQKPIFALVGQPSSGQNPH
jgi:hypothetical protein